MPTREERFQQEKRVERCQQEWRDVNKREISTREERFQQERKVMECQQEENTPLNDDCLENKG
jgi:hypothetical protein